MTFRAGRIVAFATFFSLLLSLLTVVALPQTAGASTSPAAGDCEDSAAGLICNVQGETLNFNTVGSAVQGTGTGADFNPSVGPSNAITYKNVFTSSSGHIIDAVLEVETKTGTVTIDVNSQVSGNSAWTYGAIFTSVGGYSSTEFTVNFKDRDSGGAVTMQNITVLVQDLDSQITGYDQFEYAVFQGLNGYAVTSTTDLKVRKDTAESTSYAPGSESGSETGVRQFFTDESLHSGTFDPDNNVAVFFPDVTSVGFLAGARGLAGGSPDTGGGIGFMFAPSTLLTGLTENISVSSGQYTVTYDEDSANGGSGTPPAAVTGTGAITLSTGSGLTNSGTSTPISAWSSQPNGQGSKYPLGSSFTPVKDVTLYAVYEAKTVTFKANTGTGADYTQSGSGPTALSANTFTKSGYRFAGWATNSDGSGATYANQGTFSFAVDDILYAKWAEEFDLTFDSNGGTGTMSAQTEISSASIRTNSFTRSGYTFAGWNTAANGTGTAYANGASFPFTADDTLYAQWTLSPASSSGSSSGSSSNNATSAQTTTQPPNSQQPRIVPVAPNTQPVPRPVERLGFVFDPDAPSRATVGGAPANLVKTPVGSKDLSIAAGAFQFGVSLADADGAEVQTDTPSQSPELFVPRGQSAAVSGQGSYPGSFVQLFLPGNGNDSRELARIPVRSDGTFASDLSFEAGALELPVPIGRQVLQVVGYDELGNQTVVDMTVNIGQGVPAPEPNREAGELPALTAGQSLATSGGIPESVAVTGVPETGNVVVEGSGWVISVNADRDNGTVENADGNVLVRLNPSSVGTTFGNGFLPGTLATVWLFSEPTLMTTVTVDENGEFSAEFLVDARLIAPGEHTLQVQGVGSDGYIKAANLGVLVEEPVELSAESASNMLWWVAAAFLALALLVFLLLLARRRRAQEH